MSAVQAPAPQRAQREQRTQDLLLASALLRQQAAGDLHLLATQADQVGRRWIAVRAWLQGPAWRTGVGAAGALTVVLALRRLRWMRLARWAWLGWRAWRVAAPWVGPWVAPRLAPWVAGLRAAWVRWARPAA